MAEPLEIRPFRLTDLDALKKQIADPAARAALASPGVAPALAAAMTQGFAWAGLWRGKVVGIAALAEKWQGSAVAWAYFTAAIPKSAWPRIAAFARLELARGHRAGFARIEASSRCDFTPATRLLRVLGFGLETPRPCCGFAPDGAAHYLWARLDPREPGLGTVSRETRPAAHIEEAA